VDAGVLYDEAVVLRDTITMGTLYVYSKLDSNAPLLAELENNFPIN
jgi:hypothetical protein